MSELPTLYEYYTKNGISHGLSSDQPHFLLNNQQITIYSGALHYFRVPPQYWPDRLRKIRAAGLNTVETYIPWNLHEPQPGNFDFGNGTTEFSEFLQLEKFIKLAQQQDLFVIVRPGPYICAEWEFGGLPSWLLRTTKELRTCDSKFLDRVSKYFTVLLPKLSPLQFTKGGAIIAVQIENEYGNTKRSDRKYLEQLKEFLEDNGIVELLFTSDTPSLGFSGTLPNVLATANFQENPIEELTLLKEFQPEKPLMVMEYWTGWFDHWTEKHHSRTADVFGQVLEEIFKFGSSVNMYMFHGGTNWGFLNGANIKDSTLDNSQYQPDVTSYDYDAPLSEAGDYTDKYYKVKELIQKYNRVLTKLPEEPKLTERKAIPDAQISEMLTLEDLVQQTEETVRSKTLLPMELLDFSHNAGQSYGYINYRKENMTIPANSVLKIEGHVCDTILVLINGELISKIPTNEQDLNGFGFWRLKDSTLNLGTTERENAVLDLLVENFGRVNYGKLNQFNQHKGLWQGHVLINNEILSDWKIVPLEFKKKWIDNLSWKKASSQTGPGFYKSTFEVTNPVDTFIDLRNWNKGFVAINGFVLARYWKLGPQQTAYLPGVFLKKGSNEICFFEHFQSSSVVKFRKDAILELTQ